MAPATTGLRNRTRAHVLNILMNTGTRKRLNCTPLDLETGTSTAGSATGTASLAIRAAGYSGLRATKRHLLSSCLQALLVLSLAHACALLVQSHGKSTQKPLLRCV